MLKKQGFCLIKRFLCSATRTVSEEFVEGKSVGRMTGELNLIN